ncbi:hypothetical protein BH18ACT5_BH18ACT5_18940 [soil metagenome]
MATFAGEIWLPEQPSDRLSGLLEIDSWWVRVVVDGQEIGNWERSAIAFAEATNCFELAAAGETLCFAPTAPTLFREEVLPGSIPKETTGLREAFAQAQRHRRWNVKRPWIAAAVAVPVVMIAISTAGQGGDPRVRTTTTAMAAEVTVVPTTEISGPPTTIPVLIEETAVVASITDGDTFRVVLADGTNEPVRLIGIDAPEPNDPLGPEASALLHSLLSGQTVTLVPDVSDRDRFDRLLRYVYVGDVFVNEKMVESGLAIAQRFPPDIAMADDLEEAQRRAEANNTTTSLSTTTTTTIPPASTLAPTTTATAPPATTAAPAANCHSSYEGACLTPGIGDYDCAGGSGNGPNYVRGPVYVVGHDEFDLDGNDNDGIGCE